MRDAGPNCKKHDEARNQQTTSKSNVSNLSNFKFPLCARTISHVGVSVQLRAAFGHDHCCEYWAERRKDRTERIGQSVHINLVTLRENNIVNEYATSGEFEFQASTLQSTRRQKFLPRYTYNLGQFIYYSLRNDSDFIKIHAIKTLDGRRLFL